MATLHLPDKQPKPTAPREQHQALPPLTQAEAHRQLGADMVQPARLEQLDHDVPR